MRALVLIAALASCNAYQRHPVTTVASVSVLAVAPVGICVGIGDCGDSTGSWQQSAAHYGIAQVSVLAVMAAGLALSWADGWSWER